MAELGCWYSLSTNQESIPNYFLLSQHGWGLLDQIGARQELPVLTFPRSLGIEPSNPHACKLLVDRLSHSITFRPMYDRVRGTLLGIYLGLAYQLEFPSVAVCLRLFSILLTPTRLGTESHAKGITLRPIVNRQSPCVLVPAAAVSSRLARDLISDQRLSLLHYSLIRRKKDMKTSLLMVRKALPGKNWSGQPCSWSLRMYRRMSLLYSRDMPFSLAIFFATVTRM